MTTKRRSREHPRGPLARLIVPLRSRRREEDGQAAMLVLVALLVVLSVIPTMTVTQVFGSLPLMTAADLRVDAAQAARSGLELFVSAVEQDPHLISSGFPPPSAIEPQSMCQSGTSTSPYWREVVAGDPSTGQPTEEVLVAVQPPPNGATSGPVTVFSEGRAGSLGHFVCDEEKLATVMDGPVIDGPAPGSWKTYPSPSWAKAIYVSMAGAAGQGCENVPGGGQSVCAYGASGNLPEAGAGAQFTAELPVPSTPGGTIGIGVGAQPAASVPSGQQPALDPGDTSTSGFDLAAFGYGGPSGWTPSTSGGLVGWLASDLHGADPTASFPGGGATMVYWCPPGPKGPEPSCSPSTPGATPLAVAGGGGGSGSDGATFLTATIYVGGNGGSGGVGFGGLGPSSGPWTPCTSSNGCVAPGGAGTAGGGIPLIGPGGGGGGCGGGVPGCSPTSSGSPPDILDGQPEPAKVGDCNFDVSFLGLDLASADIPYSGGGGGGGYMSGYQGTPGNQGFLNLFCDSISGSGGGGGGASYLEPGAEVMPSSLASDQGQGFAQLWFSASSPASAESPVCDTTLVQAPAKAEDAAVLLEGASGYSNSDAPGGAGAEVPVVVEVPAHDSLVASCKTATGGRGGDTETTPTPAGAGGNATVLCLVPPGQVGGSPPPSTCSANDVTLAVAGGGGGAGDQGQAGGSMKACLVACGTIEVGPVGSGFDAGAGGNAGIMGRPFGTPGSSTFAEGSTGQTGTLGQGGFCIKLFSYSYCPSWSLASASGGGGGGSPPSGESWQGNAIGSAGEECQVCEYDLAGRYTWLEGGSGGGGAGYAGGVGGNGGSGTCDSGGTGISCGLFGCFGVDYIYGWAVPGGGGGGGSTFVGGALGAGYGGRTLRQVARTPTARAARCCSAPGRRRPWPDP